MRTCPGCKAQLTDTEWSEHFDSQPLCRDMMVIEAQGKVLNFALKNIFSPPSKLKSLVEMNDNGKTFAEIADLIESEPNGLFVEER